jgi:cytochrome c553
MHTLRIVGLLLGSAAVIAISRADDFPSWAYPVAAPAPNSPPAAPDDGRLRHVPGSEVALSRKDFEAHVTAVPDWHPEDHPPMPKVVKVGREPAVWACAYCHLPNGAGRPENTSLAGLTPAYFRQQISDFRKGLRTGSEPKRAPENFMIALSKTLTDEETNEAASYFASLKPESFVRVAESDVVPRTYVAGAMLAQIPKAGTESMGDRIIEFPVELERAENRDPRTPYMAYVPVGSLGKGKALAAGEGGRTLQCAICHGPGLKGLADVPRLAGRSPSYLMRQLYDFKSGTRIGATGLMKPVVANLTQSDMVALAAFVANLPP